MHSHAHTHTHIHTHSRIHTHTCTCRQSGAPFALVINLILPGTPLLNLVTSFVVNKHPDVLGKPPSNPENDNRGWMPFDLVLYRCVGVRERV